MMERWAGQMSEEDRRKARGLRFDQEYGQFKDNPRKFLGEPGTLQSRQAAAESEAAGKARPKVAAESEAAGKAKPKAAELGCRMKPTTIGLIHVHHIVAERSGRSRLVGMHIGVQALANQASDFE